MKFILAQHINRYLTLLFLFAFNVSLAQFTTIQQSDIPLIIINTDNNEIEADDKISAQMKIVNNPTGVNNFDGPYTYNEWIGIETRGSASLIYPKKSYSLETRDAEGNNLNAKLLGFPLENDWIFDGPYDDKTMMRNHLAYDLSREMGWYAPRAKFFNLVIDSAYFDFDILDYVSGYDYKGVHVLLERIKRDDDRVDVSLLRPDEIDLPGTPNGFPDVTGGYIIKVDENPGGNAEGWISPQGSWNYVYTYPKADEIATQQVNYIKNFVTDFEMIINSPNLDDPVNGYSTKINRDSFIDFIIIQELTKNIDGYRKSSYFHKTKNSKDSLLYAGPIWDFNLAFGNSVNYNGSLTTGFQYNFNEAFPNDLFPVPFYWATLMQNESFAAEVACRYNLHRGGALSNNNILGKIDSMATVLETSQMLNYTRYDVLGEIISNETPGTFNTYQEATDELKNWLNARLEFLDSQWIGDYFNVKSTSGNFIVCPETTVTLSVEGSVNDVYEWSPSTYIVGDPFGASVEVVADSTIKYIVTGYNSFGCTDTAKIKVTIGDELQADAGEDVQICAGESIQLNATGGLTYNWSPVTDANNLVLIDDATIANPIASPTATTTFIVMATNGSCIGTDTLTITVAENLEVSVNSNIEIYDGETAQLEASGADNYTWLPANGSLSCLDCPNPIATPSSTTTYMVTGTSGACSGTKEVTVFVNSCDLNTTISANTFICNEMPVQLQATGGSNYVWSPNDGTLSCLSCSNPMANPTENTNYEVIISEGDCSVTETVSVNVELLETIFPNPTEKICSGESLTYNLTALSSYTISPISTVLNENGIISLQPAETTTYTLESNFSNNCTTVEMLTVEVEATQSFNIGDDAGICSGASVQLNPTNNIEGSFSWSPTIGLDDANSASPIASPSETTIYTLSVTSNNLNCATQAEITVEVSPVSFASVGEDPTICAGGQAQLTAFGGESYSWSPQTNLANPNSFNPIASPFRTRAYTVAVTNENGCIDEREVVVFVKNELDVFVSEDKIICLDGQGVPLEASGAFVYSWRPAEGLSNPEIANPIANPAATQVYTLTATDGACTVVKEVEVAVLEESLIANAGEDETICKAGQVQLQATGGVGFQWHPQTGLDNYLSPSPIATPSQTTTYVVTTINLSSCTDFDEITVFVEESIIDNPLEASVKICEGASFQFNVENDNELTYSWSPTTGLDNPTIANPTASPLTNTTYQLQVSNKNNCSNVFETTIEVSQLSKATAGKDVLICKGDSIRLNAEGADTYIWNANNTLSNIEIARPFAQPATTTQYMVTMNLGNCQKLDTITVEVIDFENASTIEQITICEAGAATLFAPDGDSFLWSSTTAIENTMENQQFIRPSEATAYTVEITTGNCSYFKTFEVEIGAATDATLANTLESCLNSEIQLNLAGSNLTAISWLPATGLNNPNISKPNLTLTKDETYTVSFVSNENCISQLETQVKIIDSIKVALNGTAFAICEGESQQLTADGGAQYQWTPSTGLDQAVGNTVMAAPTETTTYTVAATDQSGTCMGSNEVTIIVNSFASDAGAIDDFKACPGDEIQLSAIGGINYKWSPAALLDLPNTQNPRVLKDSLTSTQTFTVLIVENNCVLEDAVTITVDACLVEFVPSAFSPNSDGINDFWVIPDIERYPENQLNVYNRWGQLVYSSINYKNNWGGDFRSAPLPEATYYFVLNIATETEPLRGTVSIIR